MEGKEKYIGGSMTILYQGREELFLFRPPIQDF